MRRFQKAMFWLHYWLGMPGCLMEKSLVYKVSARYFRGFSFLEVCVTEVYRISPAIRRGFPLSRMTTNN